MLDARDFEYGVGDTVAVGVRQGNSGALRIGEVVKITELEPRWYDGKQRWRVSINTGSDSLSHITNVENIVKLD